MFFFTYTAFFWAIICLAYGSFLMLWRKQKDVLAYYFCLHVFAVCLWVGSNAFADIAQTPQTLIFWCGLAFIGVSFFVSYYLCFVYVFTHQRPVPLARRIIYFLPAVIFSLGAFSKYSVVDTFILEDAPSQIIPGVFYTYHLYFFIISLLYSSVSLVKFFWYKADPRERRQAIFMESGFFILFAATVFFGIILPLYFNELRFFNVGPQFSVFLVLLSSYAILRHRLFDIELLVKKGAVFTLLFAFILLFFNTIVSLSAALIPGAVSNVLAALIITIIFAPLQHWLEQISDRIFFRRRLSFDVMIKRLNQSLEKVQQPNDFITSLSAFLRDTLKIEKAAFLIADEQGNLQPMTADVPKLRKLKLSSQSAILHYYQDRISHKQDGLEVLERDDLDYRIRYEEISDAEKKQLRRILDELHDLEYQAVVPFIGNDKMIGLVLLGSKLSGDQLSEPDFRLLEALAHEGSVTVQNAISAERTMRLNDLKNEFIKVVSHQLRTPLSAAKWNTDALLSTKLRPQLAGPMADIQINLSKISDGLTSMLTVMEIAEDKVFLNKTKADVGTLLASVAKGFSTLKTMKKIEVVLPETTKTSPASFDTDKIRKVLSVLMANALMYSPEKSTVTVDIKATAKQIKVAIEDQGIGVAKKDREEIFEKFFRGEEAKRMAPDGLGVNLYIARDFVTRHGGKLWVEDREDGKKGSRFVFTIPTK